MNELDEQTILALGAYLEGDLPEAERLAFERRLETEPALRRELDELRRTLAHVAELPPPEAPGDFDRALARRIRRRAEQERSRNESSSGLQILLLLLLAGVVVALWAGRESLRVTWGEDMAAGSGDAGARPGFKVILDDVEDRPRKSYEPRQREGSAEAPPVELLPTPAVPSRTSRDPIAPVQRFDFAYTVQTSLQPAALRSAAIREAGAADVREGSGSIEVRLDPGRGEIELRRLLELGAWTRTPVPALPTEPPRVRLLPAPPNP
jgi:hypothetical protein